MEIDSDMNQAAAKSNRRKPAKVDVPAKTPGYFAPPRSEQQNQRLVQQLELHQIELEMQNEELKQAYDELELSRNTYSELYDFAPVGYFTLDRHGLIHEANFSGAHMLGVGKGLLINRTFSDFIRGEDQRKIFFDHLHLVLQRKTVLKYEIQLTGTDGAMIIGQLQSIVVTVGINEGYILTAITDGTLRRQLETRLLAAHNTLEVAVHDRTLELSNSNTQLTLEIEERKKAKASLLEAYSEIKRLKDLLEAENIYLQQEVDKQYNFGEIVGQSAILTRVFSQVEQVAPMNATVLLLGETGTGKGVVGPRHTQPQYPQGAAADNGQLYDLAGHSGGKRTLRPRTGRLHRL